MTWEGVPSAPALPPGEVHVWRVALDDPAPYRRWQQALAADEVERAARYRWEEGRRRFTAARGCLRDLLSRYLGQRPADLTFACGAHGKPALAPAGPVAFNLSHAGDLALVAVAREREVGVDLERTVREVAWEQVAQRFFAAREREALSALPPAARRPAFFRCWTRKEAYMKATGQGMALGLSRFAVTLGPDEPAALAWTEDGLDADWSVADVDPGAGWAGAVCGRGRDWRLRLLRLV